MSLIAQLNDAVPKMKASRSLVSLVMGTPAQIANANASRWAIGFALSPSAQTTGGIGVDIEAIDPSNQTGFPLTYQMPPLWFFFRRHGVLVTGDWYALSAAGPSTITVYTLDLIDYYDK